MAKHHQLDMAIPSITWPLFWASIIPGEGAQIGEG